MNRHKIIFVIFLFLGTVAASAQIDDFIENEMELENIPGLAACVIKNQEVVWSNAYGWANIEEAIPVTTTTQFQIASLTKLVTATAAMQLYEQDLLDLDADINEYLDFELRNPNYPNNSITLRMLLQHKSSLKDPEGDMYNYWEEGDHSADLHDFLLNIITPTGTNYHPSYWSSSNAPGVHQLYSNIGFALIGLIVEQVSGIPFHAYCKTHIFEPLCMEQTTFLWEETEVAQRAMPYDFVGGSHLPLGYYSIALYPSALIKTNVLELANFLLAYTGRGTVDGFQLLQNSSIDLLTPYSFSEENLGWWNGINWTFTFHFPDDEVWFHGGFMPGIRTRLNYYPTDSTGIIILTNGEGQYSWTEEYLAEQIINFATTSPTDLACHNANAAHIPFEKKYCIYPTINNGTFHVKGGTISHISITDMNARQVPFTRPSSSSFQVDHEGTIIIRMTDSEGNIFTAKSVIIR